MIDPDSVSEGTAEIMQAHHRIKQLEQENEQLHLAVSTPELALAKECAELRAERDELRRGLNHKEFLTEDWREKCIQARAERDSLKEEVERLKSEASLYEFVLKGAKDAQATMEAENASLRTDLASAREEVAKCHEVFGHESDKLGAEIKRLSEGLGKVKNLLEVALGKPMKDVSEQVREALAILNERVK